MSSIGDPVNAAIEYVGVAAPLEFLGRRLVECGDGAPETGSHHDAPPVIGRPEWQPVVLRVHVTSLIPAA